MKRYVEGDVAAFQVLVERHGQKIYNFIFRYAGDRATAEELLQDVFLRVIKRAKSFKQQSKFTTWLYTIARNVCIDAARKARYRHTISLDEPISRDNSEGVTLVESVADDRPDQERQACDARFRRKLEIALGSVPHEQREVFVMREFQGLKFREIADVVGIPENTVKSRMRYALAALRTALAEFEETL